MLDWLLSLPLAGSTEFGLLSLVSLTRVTHSTPSILLGYLFDDSSLADLFLIYWRHLLASSACFRAQRSLRLFLKSCVLLRCVIGWVLWIYRYSTAVKFSCTTLLLFRRSLNLIVVEYLYSWLLRVSAHGFSKMLLGTYSATQLRLPFTPFLHLSSYHTIMARHIFWNLEW